MFELLGGQLLDHHVFRVSQLLTAEAHNAMHTTLANQRSELADGDVAIAALRDRFQRLKNA
jgi:hypothetical protein